MNLDRKAWRAQVVEPALDPDLPIVDAHHHIWTTSPAPPWEGYGPDDLLADMRLAGHKVVASVYADSHSNYRSDGPEHLRPVGETEYVHQVGERFRREGGPLACAGIVSTADMMLGAKVGETLDAHMAASPRFRGIRYMTAIDPDLPPVYGAATPGLMMTPKFREGFAEVVKRGLTFDAWLFHPQLPELLDLARAFPDAHIVLDHTGGPLRVGRYAERRAEAFAEWRAAMAQVAGLPHVTLKIGALNMNFAAMDAIEADKPFSSEKTAELQHDHVLAAIDLFGPKRCMFESNFPVEMLGISYNLIWNAFKRMSAGFSPDERKELFAGTAIRTYRLDDVKI
jgi:predicted TIM-barrel fold metal-dependent hydrolase